MFPFFDDIYSLLNLESTKTDRSRRNNLTGLQNNNHFQYFNSTFSSPTSRYEL